MKRTSHSRWVALQNQENQASTVPRKLHMENNEQLTGWEVENPLNQHNFNVDKLNNKLKQSSLPRKINYGESKTSHRRRRTGKNSSTVSQRNIQPSDYSQQTEQTQLISEHLRNEFSNIQFLKFQAKHLQNEENSNNRFPTYSGFNITEMNLSQAQQNVNQFQIYEGFEVKRKIRTESTKRAKKQSTASQNSQMSGAQNLKTIQSKFYKTLTNDWLKSVTKNQNLMIEPYLSKQSNGNEGEKERGNCSLMKVYNAFNEGDQQQHRAIHWKKNMPFTKFFHSKKNKGRNKSEVKDFRYNFYSNVKSNLKQVQGRKLYQLLSLNRQVIQLEDF